MIKFQEVTIKLQKLIRTTDETLSNLRMKINVNKTKVLIWRRENTRVHIK